MVFSASQAKSQAVHIVRGIIVLLLSGCAGSELNPAGTTHITGVLCGAPFELHDGKERGEVSITITCPDGSEATLTSTESLAFKGQEQAAADQARLLELVNRILFAGAGAVIPRSGEQPTVRQLPPPLIVPEPGGR